MSVIRGYTGMDSPLTRVTGKRMSWTKDLLLPDNLHQHPLLPPPIEFTINDLLPWSEVEVAVCDRNHSLAAHHLSLDVRVGVIFASLIVVILAHGFVWRELLEPCLIILVQPTFVIINENRSRNVHRIHQRQTLYHAALPQALLNLWRDVDKRTPDRHVEPQFLTIALHD